MKTKLQGCSIRFGTSGGQHFFGYYDVSPLDREGRRLLTHRVKEANRMPRAEDVVEIGVWDIDSGQYRRLANTSAYNWQQGSKLQWLGPDFSSRIIFNDRQDDHFVSRIIDVESGEEQVLDYPIYTVSPKGDVAICTNFERSYFPRPGYSYQGVVKPEWDVPLHPDDGLFRLQLDDGALRRIISTEELVRRHHLSSMDGAPHYLEHAMYNTDGSRFVFLHRWRVPDGAAYTRAYTADANGHDVRLLLDSGHFSHCGWRTPNELTAFASKPSKLKNLRRHRAIAKLVLGPLLPIYRRLFSAHNPIRKAIGGGGYLQLYDDALKSEPLDPGVDFPGDGHCTWHPTNKRWMLTDTYEDEDAYRHLLLYDRDRSALVELGRFYSPPETNSTGWRCDLHPRFSHDGASVVIDSMHSGERQVYVLDVSEVVGAS